MKAILFLTLVRAVLPFTQQQLLQNHVLRPNTEAKARVFLRHKPLRASGLYKKFADLSWEAIEGSGLFEEFPFSPELQYKEAKTKQKGCDSTTRIKTRAATSLLKGQEAVVEYARIALIETVSDNDSSLVQYEGVQVLNFLVVPSKRTSLPVLGADFVSLPGNRHLLLLDAQPMSSLDRYNGHWKSWHKSHVEGKTWFPWGGDLPEEVQQYVSKHCLWTRLQGSENPVSTINKEVWNAFVEHVEEYFNLLRQSNAVEAQGSNSQTPYFEYRRVNDPAKPMLKSLYGAEWTDRILDEVLFPREL